MDDNRRWSNRVVAAAVVLAGLGAAHLIDYVLSGKPAGVGLSNEQGHAVVAVSYGAWRHARAQT